MVRWQESNLTSRVVEPMEYYLQLNAQLQKRSGSAKGKGLGGVAVGSLFSDQELKEELQVGRRRGARGRTWPRASAAHLSAVTGALCGGGARGVRSSAATAPVMATRLRRWW